MSVFNIFKGGKSPKLTEEEIEKEISEIKKQIQGERKAIEVDEIIKHFLYILQFSYSCADLKKLVDMYERARDEQGKKMTESKVQEINKNIDNLKKKKAQLKQQLPPRPLPQPVFVQVSSTRASIVPTAAKPKPPPVLKVDDLVIKQPPALIVPPLSEDKSEKKPLIDANEDNNQSYETQTSTKPTTGPLAEKAKAIWSFESRHPDELPVSENELVTILQRHGYTPQETEWCLVRNSTGKVGYVPSNYLESESNGDKQNLKPGVLFQVVSIHDYMASKEDELSFSVDEVIDVVQTEFPGWWLGVLNGKTGLFPSNFVKKVGTIEQEVEEAPQKFPFSAVGLYDYEAQVEDELSFKEGQPLQILSKEMNGWYKGKITLPNKTEKVGLIAANFIKQVEQKSNVQEKAQVLNKENKIEPKNNNYNVHAKGQYAPPPANPKSPQAVGKSSVTKPPPPKDEKEPLLAKENQAQNQKGCCTIV